MQRGAADIDLVRLAEQRDEAVDEDEAHEVLNVAFLVDRNAAGGPERDEEASEYPMGSSDPGR